jgi:hypothetical protein
MINDQLLSVRASCFGSENRSKTDRHQLFFLNRKTRTLQNTVRTNHRRGATHSTQMWTKKLQEEACGGETSRNHKPH